MIWYLLIIAAGVCSLAAFFTGDTETGRYYLLVALGASIKGDLDK